ncbi:MAG TPA: ABC transporter substrate-binding protein [Candidatus Binataceae bacterium]|nr:ABC transporter substrate-binding protein [Candidatus Binataceae bacterium]
MTKLSFPLARRYDTRFLLDGTVKVPDVLELSEIGPAPWPLFVDMITKLSHDIAEQSFSNYVIARDRGQPLTAIAAFPSRFFPHYGLMVHKSANIHTPADLVGKRIGMVSFGVNYAMWLRGILTHQYDIACERIHWVEDHEDMSGLEYPRPRRYWIEKSAIVERPVRGLPNAHRALERGEVDAIAAAGGGPPPTAQTARLFADPDAEIRAYVRATGVFPLNTLITLKQSALREYPDLARDLLAVCQQARRHYHAQFERGEEHEHMGTAARLLRELDLFPDEYGLQVPDNRKAIAMGLHYAYEQGLVSRLYEPEEMFAA